MVYLCLTKMTITVKNNYVAIQRAIYSFISGSLSKYIAHHELLSISYFPSFVMAIGLSLHYFGYELARAASLSLLTAKDGGLAASALPLTVAVGCPASAITLFLYTKSIRNNGAQLTFRYSNISCILIFLCMNLLTLMNVTGVYRQILVVIFYSFREIYVSLISTQLWSFIVSALDPSSSHYIVTFGGAVSIASTFGGCMVEQIVGIYGVQGLLFASLLSMIVVTVCAEIAHAFSQQKTNITENSKKDYRTHDHQKQNEVKSNKKKSDSLWNDSWNLLVKNETLWKLLIEALMHQCCSNMLNVMFHDGLRKGIVDDGYRAVVIGRFFAVVNFSSCLLQCFVIPKVLRQSTLPWVIVIVPAIVLSASLLSALFPCLLSVMTAFGTLKVLEYSVLSGASEMIYMPMDHDTRYLGKELVKFLGLKLGRSGASLLLSTASARFQPSLVTMSLWGSALVLCWGGSMCVVSRHLHERYDPNDQQTQHQREHHEKKVQSHETVNDKILVSSSSTSRYLNRGVGRGLNQGCRACMSSQSRCHCSSAFKPSNTLKPTVSAGSGTVSLVDVARSDTGSCTTGTSGSGIGSATGSGTVSGSVCSVPSLPSSSHHSIQQSLDTLPHQEKIQEQDYDDSYDLGTGVDPSDNDFDLNFVDMEYERDNHGDHLTHTNDLLGREQGWCRRVGDSDEGSGANEDNDDDCGDGGAFKFWECVQGVSVALAGDNGEVGAFEQLHTDGDSGSTEMKICASSKSSATSVSCEGPISIVSEWESGLRYRGRLAKDRECDDVDTASLTPSSSSVSSDDQDEETEGAGQAAYRLASPTSISAFDLLSPTGLTKRSLNKLGFYGSKNYSTSSSSNSSNNLAANFQDAKPTVMMRVGSAFLSLNKLRQQATA